jgi:hypothetical protein
VSKELGGKLSSQTIREGPKKNNREISDRGGIPGEIGKAFDNAH